MRGNAEGSTLRLSLGCLLSRELGIDLHRVGSGKRLTFVDGEQVLSDWLGKNAKVWWILDEEPWLLEPQLISTLSLPLNIGHNSHHQFYATLRNVRAICKRKARQRSIVDNSA